MASNTVFKSIMKTGEFWEILLGGCGWGELALILATACLSPYRTMTNAQTFWIAIFVAAVFVSIVIFVGFLLVVGSRTSAKTLLMTFLVVLGAGSIVLAVAVGLMSLASSYSSDRSIFADFGTCLSIVLLIPTPFVMFGYGFVLTAGIPFSISRFLNPTVKAQSFTRIGIVGAIIGFVAIWAVSASSWQLGFLFLLANALFLLPATLTGTLFLMRVNGLNSSP